MYNDGLQLRNCFGFSIPSSFTRSNDIALQNYKMLEPVFRVLQLNMTPKKVTVHCSSQLIVLGGGAL